VRNSGSLYYALRARQFGTEVKHYRRWRCSQSAKAISCYVVVHSERGGLVSAPLQELLGMN